MPRYRLLIEYDGTPYVGWQRQITGPSIQQSIEKAIFYFCNEQVTLFVAGRTDAGVHALGQIAHFDLEKTQDPFRIQSALNYYLHDKSVVIIDVTPVSEDFHARFSATSRSYLYRILNRRAPTAILTNRVWHVKQPLNVENMKKAAICLLGEHDFTSFRASQCQAASPLKSLDVLNITINDEEIHFELKAKSFLHHQVRNIVGTLVQVGLGKWQVEDVKKALQAKDRAAAGPTAPAAGLYLTSVGYPTN